MPSRSLTALALGGILVIVLGVTGCAGNVAGTPATASAAVSAPAAAVPGPAVARSVSAQLATAVGRTPDSVTCPDLPAAVGTVIRCRLVDGTDTYGVTVTAVAVEDGTVRFDALVDVERT